MRLASGLLLLASPLTAAAEEPVKIAVIPTQLEASAKGAVPDLFDDYLLTAVQNTSAAQVIGQDDIGAMLGFEKQKDMMNCDDTACMADIGGALGVDKIVAVKIARLGEDWVCTAKLINIKATKVEARVNEIVGGDTKALLHAVPRLTAKLFGATPPDAGFTTTPERPAAKLSSPSEREDRETRAERDRAAKREERAAATATGPNPAYGRGPRIAGTVMLLVGSGLAVLGGLWATSVDTCADSSSPPYDAYDTGSYCNDSLNIVYYMYSTILIIAGTVVSGVGAKLRANGAVRRDLGDNSVSGKPGAYWLGWVLTGVTIATPFLGFVGMLEEGQAELLGWACGLGALATFLLGGTVGASANASLDLAPTMGVARAGDGELLPMFGLGAVF